MHVFRNFKTRDALHFLASKSIWILFFSLIFSMSVIAADIISIIQYPLINQPQIVTPVQNVHIQCKVNASATVQEAYLALPEINKTWSLTVNIGTYDSQNRIQTYEAVLPAGIPYELYDLVITIAGYSQDRVENSVRVIPEFKNRFSFVHLPDCHLPRVNWIGFYDDGNTIPEFRQIIDEINILNPEFILQTGDLVDNGQDEDHYEIGQELLTESEIPTFITGGNHDLWYNGHDFWYKYFGRTMDYSFIYSDIRFIGMEMYDIPKTTFSANQMTWLKNQLNTSILKNETSRIIFTHYDESRQLTGELFDQYLVDGLLYGHTHINGVNTLGLGKALKLNTSFTMNDNGEYRLITIENGNIVDYPVVQFKQLQVHTTPANDGSSWKMRSTINNQLRSKETGAGIALEDALIKLHVRRDAAPYTVSGGTIQQYIDYDNNKRVYYILADVSEFSQQTITLEGSPLTSQPPMIQHFSPPRDTSILGGQTVLFQISTTDADSPALQYQWFMNGEIIPGATSDTYAYQPPLEKRGQVDIIGQVSDGSLSASKAWHIYVSRSTGKPEVEAASRRFFPFDQPAVINWTEPRVDDGYLEYRLPSRGYRSENRILESGGLNQVEFIPESEGLGLGIYYCRIKSGGLYSDEFPIIIESNQAPQMTAPLGNVKTLAPVFNWNKVQGVPYYFVILTDEEIQITEDPATGAYSVEGANPIWGVLTSKNSVPYGIPDPSGTFTSYPAPLTPGQQYWWIVLNCYGNAPELTSTVQSGVSTFTVDLPSPDLEPPTLITPNDDVTISGPVIKFRWSVVPKAIGYHVYPFKIEFEEGVEVIRPIWETVITTTSTLLEYPAATRLVKGEYQWKVTALDANGAEMPSETRHFTYDAPAATLNLYTVDNKNTVNTNDDQSLSRVTIRYDAISGVDMGLALSTDSQGMRLGVTFAPGTYILTAEKEGYAPYQDTLSLKLNETKDITLRLSPDPSTVLGQVVDQFQNPVEDALIQLQHSLHPDLMREAQSDNTGHFSLSVIPGTWLVTASHSGYTESVSQSISVESGDIFELTEPLTMTQHLSSVSGYVVNLAGRPIYGATVTLTNNGITLNTNTDANGRYNFQLESGNWKLEAQKTGFTSPASRQISVAASQTLEITPHLELDAAGSVISGSVTDGIRLVKNATIKAIPASGQVRTTLSDGYGQFSISLPTGTYQLFAEKSGFSKSDGVNMTLETGETLSDISLKIKTINSSVSGLVTSDGYTPIPDATVYVNGDRTLTSEGGLFTILVPAGNHQILATKKGYLSQDPILINISDGQSVEGVDLILSPNASVIEGRIVNTQNGQGIAGAFITAVNSITFTTQSSEDGSYILNVEAGAYQINATKAGFNTSTLSTVVGQTQVLQQVNLSLSPSAAFLKGTIYDADTQEPISSARLILSPGNRQSTTQSDGSYNIQVDPMEAGYTIDIQKEGYIQNQIQTGAIQNNQTLIFDFSLSTYASLLSGQVLNEVNQPIQGVTIQAIAGTDTFLTYSNANGLYQMGLPSDYSQAILSATKSGYLNLEGNISIQISAGTDIHHNFNLRTNFAGLNGLITETVEGIGISKVTVKVLDQNRLIASTTSNDTGYYHFKDNLGQPILAEGTYTVHIEKIGYADTTLSNIILTGGQNKNHNITMRQYRGYLNGTIQDDHGNALSNVAINILHLASEKRFSILSNESGLFDFTKIPEGPFLTKFSIQGYTFPEVDTTLNSPQTSLAFTLYKNIGVLKGNITDADSNFAIPSVSVIAKDGFGNEARTSTNSDGFYELTQLPTQHPYTLTFYKGGYFSNSTQNASSISNESFDLFLQRIWGSISGTVRYASDNSLANETIINIKGTTLSRILLTNESGSFSTDALPADQYYVDIRQPGYGSVNGGRTIPLYSGGDSTNIDFIIQELEIARMEISGPTSIEPGETVQYIYTVQDTSGRQVLIDPVWTVNTPASVQDTSLLSETGLLQFKDDFIGPVWVTLTDIHSGYQDSIQISAQHQILPGNTEMTFKNYNGLVFAVPEDAVVQPLTLGLQYDKPSEIKRSIYIDNKIYKVSESIYTFQPTNTTLKDSIRISFPIPDSDFENDDVLLSKWDRKKLKWQPVSTIESESKLHVNSNELAQWALLVPTLPLDLKNLTIQPNPFSPLDRPIEFSFTPTSNKSIQIYISLVIYNMNGDQVCEIKRNELYAADVPLILKWDGRTDNGAMARNGRYMAFIEIRDAEHTKKWLKPIALVK